MSERVKKGRVRNSGFDEIEQNVGCWMRENTARICTEQSTQEHLGESIGISKKQSGECPSKPEKIRGKICFVHQD